jgi:hypothetical protein
VSVLAVQLTVTALQLSARAVTPLGTLGAVVSGQAGVVTAATALAADWLPALSNATTL